MLLRRIYIGQKYPHIYTLSISTSKNQSTEARGALYIPSYEYNYKVITSCDTILHHQYGANARIQRMYKYEQYKWRSRVTPGKLGRHAGARKDRVADGLLEIHATAAPL